MLCCYSSQTVASHPPALSPPKLQSPMSMLAIILPSFFMMVMLKPSSFYRSCSHVCSNCFWLFLVVILLVPIFLVVQFIFYHLLALFVPAVFVPVTICSLLLLILFYLFFFLLLMHSLTVASSFSSLSFRSSSLKGCLTVWSSYNW